MNHQTLIVLKNEEELLRKHLKDGNLSAFNRKKLSEELAGAQVTEKQCLPADAVCLNAQVEVREAGSGQLYSFCIVLPADADIKKGRISLFSPMAIALLGYRCGARVEWEMPGGIKTFEILSVLQHRAEAQV